MAVAASLLAAAAAEQSPRARQEVEVAACSGVYYWPEGRRPKDGAKFGILHAKCLVADSRWLFVSSANLTEYAFSINMELGVLMTGGRLPGQVEALFDSLLAEGELVAI